MRTDTAAEVHLTDSSFLLRISEDGNPPVVRCLVRHLVTGREAYIQGGPNLLAFVKNSLLNESASESPPMNTPGK